MPSGLFRFSALDYLLKPINANELITAVNRFEKMQGVHQDDEYLNVLKDAYLNRHKKDTTPIEGRFYHC